MPRYSNTNIIRLTPPRYLTVKYPEILPESSDMYVYTTRGDRYDILALKYYQDSSLWWVISRANSTSLNFDSIIPNIGEQIRIPGPSRISTILDAYYSLNLNI